MESTAYVVATRYGYVYHFAGVVSVEYNFALNIDADISQGGDIINGARKLPNQITLSVVETDVNRSPGWSRGMLDAMDALRRNRELCRVVTSMGTWDDMLLSEITATQDEVNQFGWSGDLVFMQYVPKSGGTAGSSAASTRKTQNNSSTKKNTGTKAAPAAVTSAAASAGSLAAVLSRAGISGGGGTLVLMTR